jgi:fructokinase
MTHGSKNMKNQAFFGIDLGGTKMEGVILDAGKNKEILSRIRHATEAHQGYEHILLRIKLLVEKLEKESGISCDALGIGTPGTYDPTTGIHKNSNTTCLNGKPFKEDLEKLLGIPVSMANDANCFALAEANLGVVKEQVPHAQLVFGIIMGTGVGGGLVIQGKVWNGLHGIGGEWGHNFLDESGGPCYCGKSGCVEKVISGPATEKYYAGISGTEKKLAEIALLAEKDNDYFARATIDRLLVNYGKAVASLINLLDPDAIVIGGGVGNLDLLYNQGREEILKNLFNKELKTPILKPTLGDSAGVFGAAMLLT